MLIRNSDNETKMSLDLVDLVAHNLIDLRYQVSVGMNGGALKLDHCKRKQRLLKIQTKARFNFMSHYPDYPSPSLKIQTLFSSDDLDLI